MGGAVFEKKWQNDLSSVRSRSRSRFRKKRATKTRNVFLTLLKTLFKWKLPIRVVLFSIFKSIIALVVLIQFLFAGCKACLLLKNSSAGRRCSVKVANTKEILTQSERLGRISILGGAVAVFGLVVIGRLYELQTSEHHRWLTLASKQHQATVEVHNARGTVVDSSGRPLAVSVPSASIAAHPKKVEDKNAVASSLAAVIGVDRTKVLAGLNSSKPFAWLKRDLSYDEAERVSNLKINGISVISEFRRSYPQGPLAGALLGRTGRDGYGLAGVELGFEEMLSEVGTVMSVRRDARGGLVAVGNYGLNQAFNSDEAILQLSIDTIVQGILEEEFATATDEAKARRVFGLVMDADSGEILALAQSPGFDPNTLSGVSPENLRNIVIQDNFEPGSTLKPLVVAAALEHGLVEPNELMDCENGRYAVSKHVIRDVHPIKVVSLREALVRSSNICISKVGQKLGRERLHRALTKFGFGSKTGIELPGESGGILRAESKWANIDVATHSFGHGISITALQLVRAYSSIINGGRLVTPTIRKSQLSRYNRDAPRVISERVSEQLREMLVDVTESKKGTGKKARILGVTVAGKTGTAHKVRKTGVGYDSERVMASFVGFVDGRDVGIDRRLTALVVVDEPDVTPRWGGLVAAPVFSRAVERILSHLMTLETEGLQMARGTMLKIDV